jgi:DUF971 family protein
MESEEGDLVPWPSELRVQDNGRILKVTFEDGVVGSVSSERLRNASPNGAARLAPTGVAIVEIVQVGHDGVRIGFDDGHEAGIYTWRLLRSLTTH